MSTSTAGEFVVGPAEKKSRNLRRLMRQRATVPKIEISASEAEFALGAAAGLGYSALSKRQQEIESNRKAAILKSNIEEDLQRALTKAGLPPALSDKSVDEYKQNVIRRERMKDRLRLVASLGLSVVFFGPRTIGRVFALVDRQKHDDFEGPAELLFGLMALIIWAVPLALMSAFSSTLPLINLCLSTLFPGVGAAGLISLFGGEESFTNSSKLLRRKNFSWEEEWLSGYSGSVPERVLGNAALLKQALKQEGLTVTYQVVYLKEQDSRVLNWLTDPFLIGTVEREEYDGQKVRLYVDVWDELEYNKKYL